MPLSQSTPIHLISIRQTNQSYIHECIYLKKLKYFINYISKIEYDNIKKNTQFCFIKESFLNFLLFQGRPCGLYCDFPLAWIFMCLWERFCVWHFKLVWIMVSLNDGFSFGVARAAHRNLPVVSFYDFVA